MALLSVVLASTAPGSAQSVTFGEVVDVDDDRAVHVLEGSGVPDTWVWLDRDTEDDEDEYDGGQTVYIVDTTSQISSNDIRVGSGQVSAETLDDDESLETLGGGLEFFDDDGDGEFDTGDGLYYDVSTDGGSGEISEDDIHIAGASGSDGTDLDGYSGDIAYVDGNGNEAYGDGDDVYLDSDGDDLLTAADVGLAGPHEGRIVEGDDEDVVHTLETSSAPDTWTFLDRDGNGILNEDEPVYLSQGSSQAQLLDVRIANPPEGSSGSYVLSGDEDEDDTLTSLGGGLAYYDENGDGTLTSTDTLYFDRSGSNSGVVSTLDVVLSGSDAGTLVSSDHDHQGNSLTSVTADVGYDDRDGDGTFSKDDEVYLDVDQDGYVNARDVHLTEEIGRFVQPGDDDATTRLTTNGAPDEEIFVDDDGDGRVEAEESVYLHTDTDQVGVASVRLAYPPTGGLGSQVRVDDTDYGSGATRVDGSLAYRDTEDDGAFGADDTLYVDLSGSGSGDASTGDVILSGSDAGEIVTSGHDDQGLSLTSYGGAYAFVDGDGDGSYGFDDGVVLDTDDDAFLTPADVWLRGATTEAPSPPTDDGSSDDGDDGETDPQPQDPGTVRAGESFTASAGASVRVVSGLPSGTVEVGLTFEDDCDGCSVHVSQPASPPNGTPPVPGGWQALAYRTVEVQGSGGTVLDGRVSEGYLVVQVDRGLLPEDASPRQVTLLHHADGWAALETRLAGSSTADPLRYNATLSGLSAFAVGLDERPPELLDVSPTGSTASSTPTIEASWSDNRGIDPDTVRVSLDGTAVTNASSLQATTAELRFTPDEPLAEGPHNVSVSVVDVSGLRGEQSWSFRVGEVDCPVPPRIAERTPAPEAVNVSVDAKIDVRIEQGSCPIQRTVLTVDGTRVPSTYGGGRVTGIFPGGVEPGTNVTIELEVADQGGNPARAQWQVATDSRAGPSDEGRGTPLAPVLVPIALASAASLAARQRD